MRLPPPYDLACEAEILDHLGTTRSSLHRYMKRAVDPVPVAKFAGRLVAVKAELDAWRVRQVVRCVPPPEGRPPVNDGPAASESA